MSANTNGTSDGTDIIWITLAGMFFLGTGAFTAWAASAMNSVRQSLLEIGLLVPADQAAFELADTGVGVSLPLVLGAAAVLVAIVMIAAYRSAHRRARGLDD